MSKRLKEQFRNLLCADNGIYTMNYVSESSGIGTPESHLLAVASQSPFNQSIAVTEGL